MVGYSGEVHVVYGRFVKGSSWGGTMEKTTSDETVDIFLRSGAF